MVKIRGNGFSEAPEKQLLYQSLFCTKANPHTEGQPYICANTEKVLEGRTPSQYDVHPREDQKGGGVSHLSLFTHFHTVGSFYHRMFHTIQPCFNFQFRENTGDKEQGEGHQESAKDKLRGWGFPQSTWPSCSGSVPSQGHTDLGPQGCTVRREVWPQIEYRCVQTSCKRPFGINWKDPNRTLLLLRILEPET